jgi:DNA-binding MarR family transcriptional regulator
MDSEFDAEDEYERPEKRWWPVGLPQARVGYWVRLAEARLSANWVKMLEEWRLIPSEWAVLRELYRPGRRSPVELGQVMGMSKGGMSKLIERLVNKGFVRKEVSQFDRRFRAVWLTEYGRDHVSILGPMEESLDLEFYGKLRRGGRDRLIQSLKRILTARQRRQMQEWVALQSDDYSETPEYEVFWRECQQVAAAAAYRNSG